MSRSARIVCGIAAIVCVSWVSYLPYLDSGQAARGDVLPIDKVPAMWGIGGPLQASPYPGDPASAGLICCGLVVTESGLRCAGCSEVEGDECPPLTIPEPQCPDDGGGGGGAGTEPCGGASCGASSVGVCCADEELMQCWCDGDEAQCACFPTEVALSQSTLSGEYVLGDQGESDAGEVERGRDDGFGQEGSELDPACSSGQSCGHDTFEIACCWLICGGRMQGQCCSPPEHPLCSCDDGEFVGFCWTDHPDLGNHSLEHAGDAENVPAGSETEPGPGSPPQIRP